MPALALSCGRDGGAESGSTARGASHLQPPLHKLAGVQHALQPSPVHPGLSCQAHYALFSCCLSHGAPSLQQCVCVRDMGILVHRGAGAEITAQLRLRNPICHPKVRSLTFEDEAVIVMRCSRKVHIHTMSAALMVSSERGCSFTKSVVLYALYF